MKANCKLVQGAFVKTSAAKCSDSQMGQTDALTSILTPLGWRSCQKFGEPEYTILVRFTHSGAGGWLGGGLRAGDTPCTELCYK